MQSKWAATNQLKLATVFVPPKSTATSMALRQSIHAQKQVSDSATPMNKLQQTNGDRKQYTSCNYWQTA